MKSHYDSYKTGNKTDKLILVIVFIVTFAIYLGNLPIDYSKDLENGLTRRLLPSQDAIPNTFLPYIIIQEKTLRFDSILNTVRNLSDNDLYYLIATNKGYYSAYPILPGVFALPIYLIPLLLKKIPELTYHENILKVLALGRITAAFYTALTVTLFYFLLNKISKHKVWNLVFTIFFALGTNTWTVSSRGMWQHTFAECFNVLTILIFVYSIKKPKLIPLLGFILGVGVLTRPTNIVLACVISIYVLIHQRNRLTHYILATLPTIVALAVYNYVTFGSIATEGYGARNDFLWTTPLTTSLPAYLISPARGLLFISPPLLFGLYGIYKTFRDKKFGEERNLIYRYLSVGFILSAILLGKWYTWDGAPAFGCRMLTEYIPILGILSLEITKKFNKVGKGIVVLLIIYSIYAHGNAVLFRKSRCGKDHNWSTYCLMPPKETAQY